MLNLTLARFCICCIQPILCNNKHPRILVKNERLGLGNAPTTKFHCILDLNNNFFIKLFTVQFMLSGTELCHKRFVIYNVFFT